MSGEPVSIRAVSRHFGSVRAVDDVSLDVKAGEFVSLLGPSGSGKTTLLMLIAGFEVPTGGEILMGDRSITYVPPNKRNLGMVFQRYALFPHMTVAENIGFPLRMRKMGKSGIRDRVERALDLVQLKDYGQRMPNQLSGGQQQRIALARALVFDPPVLLMDEPLGALDRKLREQMQIEIKLLHERLKTTFIYVTHDQEEALTMSDRVAVLNAGRLEQIGAPIDLYQHPANAFVADFIGKMNFLNGECLSIANGHAMVRIDDAHTVRVDVGLDRVRMNGAGPEPVRLAIRPEQLQLVPAEDVGAIGIPATIETTVFVGSFHVFYARTGAGQAIEVRVPAGADVAAMRQGSQVRISFEAAHAAIFPALNQP